MKLSGHIIEELIFLADMDTFLSLQDIFLSEETTPSIPKISSRIQKVDLMKQWGIPDTIAFIGRIFRYEIPGSAFSGRVDEYKVINLCDSFAPGFWINELWVAPFTMPSSFHTCFSTLGPTYNEFG